MDLEKPLTEVPAWIAPWYRTASAWLTSITRSWTSGTRVVQSSVPLVGSSLRVFVLSWSSTLAQRGGPASFTLAIEPLLPMHRPKPRGSRPRVLDRAALADIIRPVRGYESPAAPGKAS